MQLLKTLRVCDGVSRSADAWTIGYEELDKYGQDHKPHFHIHFASLDTEASIRKRLQVLFKTEDFNEWTLGLKGNRLYSLANADTDGGVKDLDRFYRYPLKQVLEQRDTMIIPKGWQRPPQGFDYDLQIQIAHEEWTRDIGFHLKKKEQQEKPSTKDMLFAYLDTIYKDKAGYSKRDILISICQYYNSEEKSANRATMMGYFQTALWRYKIESIEQTVDEWLK